MQSRCKYCCTQKPYVCIVSSNQLLDAGDTVVLEYTYGKNTLPAQEKTSLVDEKALDQLIEMGFDRKKATKALLVNR